MVGINIERSGAEISWEPGSYTGPVIIRAVNAENGDVGVAKDTNDGFHFLTWKPGTWIDLISVYKDTGGDLTTDDLIDQGIVVVTVA